MDTLPFADLSPLAALTRLDALSIDAEPANGLVTGLGGLASLTGLRS